MSGRHRKPAVIGVGAAVVISAITAIGFTAFTGPESHAAESCAGLETALRNNLNFIAGQRANPDGQSGARIANRQAVVDQIQKRLAAAGCSGDVAAQDSAAQNSATQNSAAQNSPAQDPAVPPPDAGKAPTQPAQPAQPANKTGDKAANSGGAGQVVCPGSTVTLSGEGGAPAASSNQVPVGTTMKVTNLDNNKSTTVKVTSVSGSCALLNNAAFDQVREPGKNLIRHARIEKLG